MARMERMRLFVGCHAWSVQGERDDLAGDRCWSAAYRCNACPIDPSAVRCLLDSGAFTDVASDSRLDASAALDRQMRFERLAAEMFGQPWRAEAMVSYDRLIDEKLVSGKRRKERWSLKAGEAAVRETIEAATYLASQRQRISPRTIVLLSCQGVDYVQYGECAAEVLKVCQTGDWFGLGGRCLLGRSHTFLQEFIRTLRRVLPMVAAAGVGHVHLFGVLWEPALAAFQWFADQHGLTASCDSAKPIRDCFGGDPIKAGRRRDYWRDNVKFWQDAVATLRQSEHYREPQRELFV